MIRLFAIFPLVFVLMLVLIAGGRAIGRQTEPPPAYLETGECLQPCWQGMRPGYSRVSQFLEQVRTIGPYTGRATDMGDDVITMFELSTFGAITLADVVREFGPPEQVSCMGLGHSLNPGSDVVVTAQVYYANGLVEVNLVHSDLDMRLSPDMQVRSIRYFAAGEPVYTIGTTTGWQGFAGASVYGLCVNPM